MGGGSAKFSSNSYKEYYAPIKVKAVTCLFNQLEAFSLLFRDNKPAPQIIQGLFAVEFLYIFGDASGSGFGASWLEEDAVGFIFGVWNEEGGGTSYNYRYF